MTLQEFYRSLPKQTSPKRDFIERTARELEVSTATVSGWVNGKYKPSRPEFYRKLSAITGIEQDKLFSNE